MSEANMKLTPEIVTGLEYKKFKSQMYSLALGQPTRYYILREKILESIETQLVKDLYNTFFMALTEGKTVGGGAIAVLSPDLQAAGITPTTPIMLKAPHYPTHLLNNIAMEAVADLEVHLQKIVEIIAPQDFASVASSRINLSGKAGSIQGPGDA